MQPAAVRHLANVQTDGKPDIVTSYSLEAEQGLLGNLMNDNAGIDRVADFLDADHFYHPTHAKIYDAILKTSEWSTPII